MKTLKNILVLLIATLGLVACKKDKPFINPSPGSGVGSEWEDTLECEDYPDSIYIHSNAWGRYQYRTPYFNPNNSQEFIYSYYDYELNTQQLIKYNMATKQKLVLANLGVYKQPKWNKNGWIAFSNMHHVHVVKDNGSEYRQISTQGQNTYPFWDGNDLFWRNSISNGSSIYQLKQKLDQLESDTLSSSFALYHSEVVNEKLLTWLTVVSGSSNYFGFFSLNTQETLEKNDFNIIAESSNGVNGLTWHPSGDFFYASHFFTETDEERGLFKITLSGQVEKIMDYCQSKRYSNISCSADGKYIIGERTARGLEQYDSYSGRIIQNSTIWLIDTETMEETKIDLE